MSKEENNLNDQNITECGVSNTTLSNWGVNNCDSAATESNWKESNITGTTGGWDTGNDLEESNTTVTAGGWDTVNDLEESNTTVTADTVVSTCITTVTVGGRNIPVINWEDSNITGLEE